MEYFSPKQVLLPSCARPSGNPVVDFPSCCPARKIAMRAAAPLRRTGRGSCFRSNSAPPSFRSVGLAVAQLLPLLALVLALAVPVGVSAADAIVRLRTIERDDFFADSAFTGLPFPPGANTRLALLPHDPPLLALAEKGVSAEDEV